MRIEDTNIKGLKIIEPDVFTDSRGSFFEALNLIKLKQKGILHRITQENQAYSYKGVLRGLHYQNPPYEQGKLVRCIMGKIQDVAVDIRKGSPTYGKYFSVILSDENNKQLWIPPGFAHGALTLSDISIMAYFCTKQYSEENSVSIKYDDKTLAIEWILDNIIVSENDKKGMSFNTLESKFKYIAEKD